MTAIPSARFTVGVDIGGTHLSAAVVDTDVGRIIAETRCSAPVDSHAASEAILKNWCTVIDRARSGLSVVAIGIAMPGPFDYPKGISLIRGLDKYESLYGINIRAELKARLNVTHPFSILFANDATSFLVGECRFGAAKTATRVIGVTIGTGLGSCFYADGKIMASGENVPENGWLYCVPHAGGIAEDSFSSRGILARARESGFGAAMTVRELAEACEAQLNPRQIFADFGRDLAEFLAPHATKFGADCIVIGGNISRAWPLFAPSLLAGMRDTCPATHVCRSILLEDAALIGAAGLPMLYSESNS
ncbi:MAG: ROK family protein [Candidatus Sumerlaeota bacterium]